MKISYQDFAYLEIAFQRFTGQDCGPLLRTLFIRDKEASNLLEPASDGTIQIKQ